MRAAAWQQPVLHRAQGWRETQAARLALWGGGGEGQRGKVRLARLLGQAKLRSDSSQSQAGMKHDLHRLTPSLSHSTNTSEPTG